MTRSHLLVALFALVQLAAGALHPASAVRHRMDAWQTVCTAAGAKLVAPDQGSRTPAGSARDCDLACAGALPALPERGLVPLREEHLAGLPSWDGEPGARGAPNRPWRSRAPPAA
jgi:hypothetical protein